MGDMAEVFNAMKDAKKERHSNWYEKNLKLLSNSGFTYTHKDTVCLFRELNKPKVDFYPHTGRWKVNNKMKRGGAEAFIKWYTKQ